MLSSFSEHLALVQIPGIERFLVWQRIAVRRMNTSLFSSSWFNTRRFFCASNTYGNRARHIWDSSLIIYLIVTLSQRLISHQHLLSNIILDSFLSLRTRIVRDPIVPWSQKCLFFTHDGDQLLYFLSLWMGIRPVLTLFSNVQSTGLLLLCFILKRMPCSWPFSFNAKDTNVCSSNHLKDFIPA